MLTFLAWTSLAIAFASALIIVIDKVKHPQKMWIMNIVWPVTALYFSVFAGWGYFRLGRGITANAMRGMSDQEMKQQIQHKEEQARRSLPGSRRLCPTATVGRLHFGRHYR
jgi:hypothetical protein